MNFVKRSKDNYWHVSVTENGIHLRIGPPDRAQVITARYAREIGEALMEATDDRRED